MNRVVQDKDGKILYSGLDTKGVISWKRGRI